MSQVIDDVKALAERLGKVPVVVGDKAGFIANALLFGYLNHAASMYEQRYATREDIDAAMKLGCGLPMGPLALLDLIGLDTAYEILDTMYKQTRDRLHAPAPIIKQMVTAGMKGRKTGRGFYTYEAPDSPVVVPDDGDTLPQTSAADQDLAPFSGSASSARARWRSASPRCSPRRVRRRACARGARSRSPRPRPPSVGRLEKAVVRGKLDEADRDAAIGAHHGQHLV